MGTSRKTTKGRDGRRPERGRYSSQTQVNTLKWRKCKFIQPPGPRSGKTERSSHGLIFPLLSETGCRYCCSELSGGSRMASSARRGVSGGSCEKRRTQRGGNGVFLLGKGGRKRLAPDGGQHRARRQNPAGAERAGSGPSAEQRPCSGAEGCAGGAAGPRGAGHAGRCLPAGRRYGDGTRGGQTARTGRGAAGFRGDRRVRARHGALAGFKLYAVAQGRAARPHVGHPRQGKFPLQLFLHAAQRGARPHEKPRRHSGLCVHTGHAGSFVPHVRPAPCGGNGTCRPRRPQDAVRWAGGGHVAGVFRTLRPPFRLAFGRGGGGFARPFLFHTPGRAAGSRRQRRLCPRLYRAFPRPRVRRQGRGGRAEPPHGGEHPYRGHVCGAAGAGPGRYGLRPPPPCRSRRPAGYRTRVSRRMAEPSRLLRRGHTRGCGHLPPHGRAARNPGAGRARAGCARRFRSGEGDSGLFRRRAEQNRNFRRAAGRVFRSPESADAVFSRGFRRATGVAIR